MSRREARVDVRIDARHPPFIMERGGREDYLSQYVLLALVITFIPQTAWSDYGLLYMLGVLGVKGIGCWALEVRTLAVGLWPLDSCGPLTVP